MMPNHGTSVKQSKIGWVFRWWFFPLMLLLFFLPPYAERGFSPERWQDVIATTLASAPIYGMLFVTPYIHVLFLVALVLALTNPARFMPHFSAYAAVSYFVFAVVQNVAWSKAYGYGVVTSNFVWFTLAGIAWGAEALSTPNPDRRLRFHAWHWWVVPLCVFAFWTPEDPWNFHPKYLVWNISVLAFCLMTPAFLAVHASFYPLANTALLRVTGCVGVLVGLINMLNAYFRNSSYNAAIHVPLLLVSGFALVLARRQIRLQEKGAATVSGAEAVGSSNAAVSVKGLVKRYGDKVAVGGVSFEVGPGEVFGLLGPNGAGKTTTVECVAGLRTPDSGTMRVAGLHPIQDGDALRRILGIQLQKAALPEALKVGEAARDFASFFDQKVDPEPLLERLDLASCRNESYGRISGGQKQRLHFLLALLGDPQVLIVDEPTTGLDPVARQAVWHLLRERAARGKSVILTTHFMQEAQVLCDRLGFIRDGKIIAEGTPGSLIRALGWSVSIGLRLDRPCRLEALQALPGVSSVRLEEPWLLLHGDEATSLNSVLNVVTSDGSKVMDIKTQEATLEDVFIALAGDDAKVQTAASVGLGASCAEEGMVR